MRLSAFIHVCDVPPRKCDSVAVAVTIQAMDRPASSIEGTVTHSYRHDERILRIRFNGLGIDERLAGALLLEAWRRAICLTRYALASEITWHATDLRPALQLWFYRQDALYIERRMFAFRPTEFVGSDVVTSIFN